MGINQNGVVCTQKTGSSNFATSENFAMWRNFASIAKFLHIETFAILAKFPCCSYLHPASSLFQLQFLRSRLDAIEDKSYELGVNRSTSICLV